MQTKKLTMKTLISFYANAIALTNNTRAWLYLLVASILCSHMATAQAGVLSKNLCKPYRQLVDNELFVTVGVIMAVVLVIAWKLAPSGTYMQKAVGLLAALAIGLNIETIFQTAFGAGLAC